MATITPGSSNILIADPDELRVPDSSQFRVTLGRKANAKPTDSATDSLTKV